MSWCDIVRSLSYYATMLLVELMRCTRICLLTVFLSLTCQMLTHTQWCWQMLTNMNIEENGQCKSWCWQAVCSQQVLTTKCWQDALGICPLSAADALCHNTLPVRWVFHIGCIDIGHRAELDSPWCSPIRSLVGSAIGSSAVLQSAKHSGGILCVPGVRISSKCSYSPT